MSHCNPQNQLQPHYHTGYSHNSAPLESQNLTQYSLLLENNEPLPVMEETSLHYQTMNHSQMLPQNTTPILMQQLTPIPESSLDSSVTTAGYEEVIHHPASLASNNAYSEYKNCSEGQNMLLHMEMPNHSLLSDISNTQHNFLQETSARILNVPGNETFSYKYPVFNTANFRYFF